MDNKNNKIISGRTADECQFFYEINKDDGELFERLNKYEPDFSNIEPPKPRGWVGGGPPPDTDNFCDIEKELFSQNGIDILESKLCQFKIDDKHRDFFNEFSIDNYNEKLNKKITKCESDDCDKDNLFDTDLLKDETDKEKFKEIKSRINKNRYEAIQQKIDHNIEICEENVEKEADRDIELDEMKRLRPELDKIMSNIYDKANRKFEINDYTDMNDFQIIENEYLEDMKEKIKNGMKEKTISEWTLGELVDGIFQFFINIYTSYHEILLRINNKEGKQYKNYVNALLLLITEDKNPLFIGLVMLFISIIIYLLNIIIE